ncbi:protein Turandot E-like [Drosophila eugracilis]|uniref:protein Turandot E-like n=1 Tax=Drosophila eugracilis TaxID=29029 RepID=UPI0007E7A8E9|nr:protein Turandot E-like [Drosophila eugracilis]XP_017081390.2 protein Turandot E-like [Drosophila eugracilis]
MNSALQFSCLLVVVGCLLGTGHCQGDDEFVTKGRGLFGNPPADTSTRARNVPAFVDYYEKYSNKLDLTTEERHNADIFVRRYKDQTSQKVDGVSAQGGFWLPFLAPIAAEVVIAVGKAIASA